MRVTVTLATHQPQRFSRSRERGPLKLAGRPQPTAAYPRQLPALRHELAGRVPDLGFLVEPAAADMPTARRDAERPGYRYRPHVPGQLHRGSPAGRAEAEHHRR